MRSASLAIFFLDLGLGEVLHLGTPGTCTRKATGVGGYRLDSPAEGTGALARRSRENTSVRHSQSFVKAGSGWRSRTATLFQVFSSRRRRLWMGHNNSAELSSIQGRDSFAALFSVSENTSFYTRLSVVQSLCHIGVEVAVGCAQFCCWICRDCCCDVAFHVVRHDTYGVLPGSFSVSLCVVSVVGHLSSEQLFFPGSWCARVPVEDGVLRHKMPQQHGGQPEGSRSKHSHTKWPFTTFHLVPAGGTRYEVKSLENQGTQLPQNPFFQQA